MLAVFPFKFRWVKRLSISPYDSRGFSNSIVKLIKDKKLLASMGKAIKSYVEKYFFSDAADD